MISIDSYDKYPTSGSGEAPDHVRTRESVQQMNADYDTEVRRRKIVERLGGAAAQEVEPVTEAPADVEGEQS
jgi:hypothetical protein